MIYFHVRGEHCLNDKIIFVIVIRFSQEPTWDTNSAFFARAAGRNPMPPPSTSTATVKNSAPSTISQSSQNTKNISTQQPAAEQIDPVVLRSRQVAGWLNCGIIPIRALWVRKMICEKQTRLVLPAFNFPNRIFKPRFLLRRDCMSQNSVQAHVKDSIFYLRAGN